MGCGLFAQNFFFLFIVAEASNNTRPSSGERWSGWRPEFFARPRLKTSVLYFSFLNYVLHNFCQFLAAAARRNLTEKQRENKMPSRLPLATQLFLSFLKWRKHFEV
jgi:hypothetical protein